MYVHTFTLSSDRPEITTCLQCMVAGIAYMYLLDAPISSEGRSSDEYAVDIVHVETCNINIAAPSLQV